MNTYRELPSSGSYAAEPGRFEELLSTEQMAVADRLAAESGVSEFDLMAAAGQAVARHIVSRWAPRPTVVLCGPGNNGGDGYVVARCLHEQGWPVRLMLRGQRTALSPCAAQHAELWTGPELPWEPEGLVGAALVVDAVFGAGLSRDLPEDVAALLGRARAHGAVICAIDVPSGVDGTTGQARGKPVAADLTVTFFRRKPGHLLLPGRELCGEVVVADIGIPETAARLAQPGLWRNTPAVWRYELPQVHSAGHKYDRGHLLVLGGERMTGAARLAALAGQRAGAGLVTIAAPAAVWPIYATAMQSVMVEPLDTEDGLVASWERALSDERRKVVLLGPGLGRAAEVRDVVLLTLASRVDGAVVLDADALSAFAGDPEPLFAAVQGPCVMTPHEGEFQRLFGVLSGSKLERARAAAARSGAVVLLKGADTVVAAPDGRAVINDNAPAWLATGGTGDVLAGLVAGLLAQGVPAFEAAAMGCWMQGRAAAFLGRGLVADDLLGMMRQVWAELGAL